MPDQNHYNLPPFGRDAPFPPAPDAGFWAKADGTLHQLGRSLKVDGDVFKDPDEPIRAIPDPWAQARTFGEALIEKGHSMHTHALGQWRGLLALFALRGGDYTLTPRPVALGNSHIFDRVLTHLSPQVALGGQIDLWRTPWLVMVEPKGGSPFPLAMTNPICLVSPGRQSLRITLKSVKWAQGEVVDPLTLAGSDALPIPEIVLLEAWLRGLRAALESVTGEECSKIRQLLQEYAEDCVKETGHTDLKTSLGASIEKDLPTLFQPLWASVSPGVISDPASHSKTRLRLNPALNLGAMKGAILVDSSLGDRKTFDARRTFIWGTTTLAELLNSETKFEEVRAAAAKEGYWLVRAEDLFTERAVRLANDPLIISHPASMQDMLMPLRPLALLLEGSLKDHVSAQATPARASVTLRLKLDDGSEAGAAHDITRHFTADAGEGQPLLVNNADWSIYNASVWPNFKSSAWDTYLARFTYAAKLKGHSARPNQALSAEHLAVEISEAGGAESTLARIADLNRGVRPSQQPARFLRSERTAEGEFEEMQFCSKAFDAIFYVEGMGDRGEAAGGMLLLDLTVRETRPNSAIVAVDFGTTNTVACFDDKLPIVFESRLLLPVAFKDPNKTRDTRHAARWVLSKFLPPEERATPTPTVAITRTSFPNDEAFWAFRNIVYFHSNQRYAKDAELDELKKFVRTADYAKFNLKWSDDPAHAEAATDFLEQFMIMVAAEAAADGRDPRHLLWRFSIPDSLGGRRRESFEGHLKAITRRISSQVSGDIPVLAPLHSEGLSAARFILSDAGFNPQSLNMVLDIGGGTTDITIWDIDRLVWKGSFLLAGQNFFTRAISQNPDILKPIGLEHWGKLFDAGLQNDEAIARKNIPHLAEMLFSGPALQAAIDANWETKLNIGTGKQLRITALVFLGGIAWYLGAVVKQLVADGLIDVKQLEKPAFALCGRGAGIFKKMHAGRDADDESDVTRALQVFAKAAGMDHKPLPQLFTTPDAKLEVVRGMIADDGLIDASVKTGKSGARDYLPVGIGISFNNGAPLTNDMLTDRSLFVDRVREVDLGQISAFLAELESTDEVKVDLFKARSQGAYQLIQDAVRTHFDKARKDEDGKRDFEPPFITALRALVDELAKPSDVREKRLTMDFTA